MTNWLIMIYVNHEKWTFNYILYLWLFMTMITDLNKAAVLFRHSSECLGLLAFFPHFYPPLSLTSLLPGPTVRHRAQQSRRRDANMRAVFVAEKDYGSYSLGTELHLTHLFVVFMWASSWVYLPLGQNSCESWDSPIYTREKTFNVNNKIICQSSASHRSVLTLCLGDDGLFLCAVCKAMISCSLTDDLPQERIGQLIYFIQLSSFVLCVGRWAGAETRQIFHITLGHMRKRDGGVQYSLHL